ncbi:MAG: right-handed parallel beta-helix repeat-containing protein [Candidatus Latescibacterota bacterium]
MPHAIVLHLSPAGDDASPGTAECPVRTLARARDLLRQLRSGPAADRPAATVLLHGGTYRLAEPVVLGPADSGRRDAPVAWRAALGETAVLSGGRVVTGWQPFRDRVWRAELPESRGGRWRCRQLFCDGQRMPRARWPKADPADPLYGGWAYIEGPAGEGSTDAFVYRPGTFRHAWARPTEVEVIYWANIGGWRSMVPIRSFDAEQRTIRLAHPGWQFQVPGWYQDVTFTPDNRFFVENALEELTEPGEWCFDSEEGALYFRPPADRLQGHEVVAPWLDGLLDLRGASWITLEGLTFTQTTDGDNFHREGVEGAGAMYPRPGWRYCGDAVHLKDCEHCRITACHFDQVGGNAVYLEGYNLRCTVARTHITYAGANGVCLMGTRLRHPLFSEVTDNHIHHGGWICKYTAGVFSGMSDGNRIAHNRIEHMPHHAINLSNSPHGRNTVEYNEIRFADQETADSAAINCWMEDPPARGVERCGHIIRFNFIADTYGTEVTGGKAGPDIRFPVSGIYLDNCTSNCLVCGNLIVRCTHAGILVHTGKNNLIENNVVVDCGAGVRLQDYVSAMPYWQTMAGFMTGNLVLRNIVANRSPEGMLYQLFNWTERTVGRAEGNLFFRPGGTERVVRDDSVGVEPAYLSLEEWQGQGYDGDLVLADPGFVDPEHDDYRLRPDSPALQVGFVPIDTGRIGPRSR